MLSETSLARRDASSQSQPQQQTRHLQSPVNSYEDWKLLEGVAEWPCAAPNEFPSNLDPDTVLGPLEEIKKDFETHSPWGGVFLNGVEKRLEEMERTLDGLANHFLIGSTAHEGEAGGQPVAKAFLTELRDQSSQRRQRQCTLGDTASNEDLTLDTLVYPGIGGGSSAVALPGTLDPLTLLHQVTKTALLPLYVQQCWQKLFHSGASCSLLQNTFWYVWLSYFKAKPDPNDLSRLFRLISDNFMSLHYSILGGQKHKDEAFIHLPGCLAKAVYSAFCHSFPQSSKVFNSEEFLSYLTNLTYQWITGVTAPLGSWKSWPRHLLDPHFNSVLEDTSSEHNSSLMHNSTFTEKDVTRLSIKDKPRSVRLSTVSGAIQKIRRTRSSHTAPSRAKTPPTNPDKNEEVGVGQGPKFKCVQFGLMARSPLLQSYLVSHGLVEEEWGKGEVCKRVRPVMGRTQISGLPPPSISYQQLLKDSKETSRKNYDHFEKALAKSEQEINAARKKHNALLRASDRRTERLLQHKYKVAIMAEKIMDKYASQIAPIVPAKATDSPPP